MDTSKSYIEMCAAATEVQAAKQLNHTDIGYIMKPVCNDVFALMNKTVNRFGQVVNLETPVVVAAETITNLDNTTDAKAISEVWNKENVVWLPRQDQLQELYGKYDQTNDRYEKVGAIQVMGVLSFIKRTPEPEFFKMLNHVFMDSSLYYLTWEKFWLLLLMHERYAKYWNRRTATWHSYDNISLLKTT